MLSDVDLLEAEAVKESRDGGAGVFAGGVEDAVGEGGLLELLLGFGAGVGFEVLVGGDQKTGGAGVDAGVLVIERGDEELGGGESDVDRLPIDADVFGFELGEVDTGDGLAVDDEQEAITGEEIGQDRTGMGAFDDGIDGIDDGFKAAKSLNSMDDGGNRGVEGGGAAGDGGGEAGKNAGCRVADEDCQSSGAQDQREQNDEEGSGGAAA